MTAAVYVPKSQPNHETSTAEHRNNDVALPKRLYGSFPKGSSNVRASGIAGHIGNEGPGRL